MKFYRNTETGTAYTENEVYKGFLDLDEDERDGKTFYQYLLECTDKDGFLQEIEVGIGGNECIGYSVEVTHREGGTTKRDTIKRRAHGGFYHPVAFGKLETAEAVKAKAEKLFADGYDVETVTKHFFEI